MKAQLAPGLHADLTAILARDKADRIPKPQYGSRLQKMLGARASFCGMEIVANPLFPFRNDCADCAGTGEGRESTYCPKCAGAGATLIVGVIKNAYPLTLITQPLPKRFQPSFPRTIRLPRQLARGLV